MIPRELGVGRCAALPPSGFHGKPAGCVGQVEWVGLRRRVVLIGDPPRRQLQVWRMFACDLHVRELPLLDVRRLDDVDRAVLERWRAEEARWQLPKGHRDRPGPTPARPWQRPAPIAVDDEAEALLARIARTA